MIMYREFLEIIQNETEKPQLFAPGEPKFWDDPHISKCMLEAHLNPAHDAASRKIETINETIKFWLETGIIKPGMKLLDLGCGPGLYAQRLASAGVQVVGLDISEGSIEYAKNQAKLLGLNIDYRHMNFFDMNFDNEFDCVIQVYGELCVFSDASRDCLLNKIHTALKKDGLFIFDVSTRNLRKKDRLSTNWYICDSGFWHAGKHLVLEQGFDYPENDVWLDQYTVIREDDVKVYRNWFHDYSEKTIRSVLVDNSFLVNSIWNDLAGSAYEENGDWIGIVAKVVKN